MDKLNLLYSSKKLEDILAFYANFKNAKELIKWSNNRSDYPYKIYEVEGDKQIVVVIITIDYYGKYAINCRKLLKGFHLIFVVSGKTLFFNYSKDANNGLKNAIMYNPKWIIIMNDDLYGIDDPSILRKKLLKVDDIKKDVVYINPYPDNHHSDIIYLAKKRLLLNAVKLLPLGYYSNSEKILDKFHVMYRFVSPKSHYHILFSKIKKFRSVGDFLILSGNFIKEKYKRQETIFDETFINGYEDILLSLRLSEARSAQINFKIGSVIGGTATVSKQRYARNIANTIIFDSKVKELFFKS
jgi:hypothetical protein